jgi:hypothetical protein
MSKKMKNVALTVPQQAMVKSVVNQQLQKHARRESPFYEDSGLFNQNVTGGGSIMPLCNVAQGTPQSNRIGDVIYMDKLELTFNLEMANTDVYTTSRVCIFQVFEDIVPTLTFFFQSPGSQYVYSNYNFANRHRFAVKYDETFHQSGTAAAPTSTSNLGVVQLNVPVGRPEIRYQPGSSTVMTNQLWIVYFSDSAVVPYPVMNWLCRLYYGLTKRG